MNKWAVGARATACVMAFAFASEQSVAQTKLNVLYGPAFNLVGAFIAKDQGYFAKHDLDVDLLLTTSGAIITAAMVSGSAQIGAATVTNLLQANEQGLDFVILAGTSAKETEHDVAGILVRDDSALHAVADLIGKKLAVAGFGGTSDLETRTWVRQHGVDPRKVNWVEMPFQRMSDSVSAGIVDAASVVDPFYSRAMAGKTMRSLGDFTSVMPKGTVSVVFAATRAWASKNARAVADFRASLEDAIAYIGDPSHQAVVLDSMARWTKLPPQAVTASAVPAQFANRIGPDNIVFWVGVSRDNDLITGAPDLPGLILP